MTETNKLFYQSEMVFDFSRYRRILRRLFFITDNQVTDLNPNKNKKKNKKEVSSREPNHRAARFCTCLWRNYSARCALARTFETP